MCVGALFCSWPTVIYFFGKCVIYALFVYSGWNPENYCRTIELLTGQVTRRYCVIESFIFVLKQWEFVGIPKHRLNLDVNRAQEKRFLDWTADTSKFL